SGFHILGELPTEDWIGIGFGVTLLLTASVAASLICRRRGRVARYSPSNNTIPRIIMHFVLAAPWLSLLAYCMKSGMVTGPRLISPYYPLLLPSLLVIGGESFVVRRRWWRVLVWLVMLTALTVLMLTPGRPLWPAKTILSTLRAAHPESRSIARAL